MNRPKLFIEFYKDLEPHRLGPFWTISFAGTGLVINQSWIAYEVQTVDLRFEKVTVPICHTIVAHDFP